MSKSKITVVGAGNVGAAAAHLIVSRGLADVVLLDVVQGLAAGKALDIAQARGVYPSAGNIVGGTDWSLASGSDIVIITSGLARKPGMSRDDLLMKNTEIVKSVTQQVVRTCPNAFIIVVCNPLDVMTYAAAKVSGFPKNRVMGMAGALDSARFACFVAEALNVDIADIRGVLMGGHGDDMVPLPRFTTVAGIPLTDLLAADKLAAIIDRTRKGGIEIVNLLGYSAYYAPAAGAVKMAEAILQDTKTALSCCAWCQGEYGIVGAYVGVPVILGSGGVERIIELNLNDGEKKELAVSVDHVRKMTAQIDRIL